MPKPAPSPTPGPTAQYKGVSISFTMNGKTEAFKSTNSTLLSELFEYTQTVVGSTSTTVIQPTVSLVNFNYKQAMYEPEHFIAELSYVGKPSFAEIRKGIVGATASVSFIKNDDKLETISANLFVYAATPKYLNTGYTEVILDIYSLDKLLELQKFSHAYTGMSLGKQILTDEVQTFDKPGYGLTVVCSPRILSYTMTDDTESHEIIQPYTVQYNETFRSMINRVANRCGEFLYWNGTALQYGLADVTEENKKTLQQEEIKEITGSTQECDDFKAFTVTQAHRDGTKDKGYIDTGAAKNGRSYDNEVGNAEFSQPVGRIVGPRAGYFERPMGAVFGLKYYTNEKDGHVLGALDYDSSDSRKFLVSSLLAKFINNSGGIMDFASDFVNDIIVAGPLGQLTAMKQADTLKKALNHRPFEGKETDRYPYFNAKEQTSYDDKSQLDSDKAECYDKISHFSTCGESGSQMSKKAFNAKDFIDKTIVLGDKFYTTIRNKGLKAKEDALDIVLKTTATEKKIGQIIKYNNTEYVVTAVNGEFTTDPDTSANVISMSIHIVPATKKDATSNFYLPEPFDQQFRHIDGNSTAFITDVKDPYGQERVRVRFTWQEEVPVQLNASEITDSHNAALDYVYPEATYTSDAAQQTAYEKDLKDTSFSEYCDTVYRNIKNTEYQDVPSKEDDGTDKYDADGHLIIATYKAGHFDEKQKDWAVNLFKVTEGNTDKYYSFYAYYKKFNTYPSVTQKDDVKSVWYKDLKGGKADEHYIYTQNHKKIYVEYMADDIDKKLKSLKDRYDFVTTELENDKKEKSLTDDLREHYEKEKEALVNEINKLDSNYLSESSEDESTKAVYLEYSKLYEPVTRINSYKEKYAEKIGEIEKEKKKARECVDSTPWIRMASPMAGKKNTLIMKPTEDTEVIVGFENGNIERPYVLGSLFGKGDCSLTGQVPAKNANGEYVSGSTGDYKIIGENGAGITITNENVKWDDILSMLGLPIIKTITSTAPNLCVGKSLTADNKSWPIGGKVRLHDKYGFYDLTMSSKDRKVSISSPVGNISLSAFSGISISAPNGDITINGKNITLKAGDKLTLISGTNKDIFDTKTTDLVGSLGKLVAKLSLSAVTSLIGTKAIDLSNYRAVWEVVFRPLNGTMSFTSGRHMLLQAGKGKVEFPIDAMKAHTPQEVVQFFPNYPYFLIQQFITEYVKKIELITTNMQNAYNSVVGTYSHARKDLDNIDIEAGPTVKNYNSLDNGQKASFLTLSKSKVLHLLNKCLILKDNKYELTTDEETLMKFCPYPKTSDNMTSAHKTFLTNSRNIWLDTVKTEGAKAVALANALKATQIAENPGKKIIKALNQTKQSKHLIAKFDINTSELDSAFSNFNKLMFTPNQEGANTSSIKVDYFIGGASEAKLIAGTLAIGDGRNVANEKFFMYHIIKFFVNHGIIIYTTDDVKKNKKRYKNCKEQFPDWVEAAAGRLAGPTGFTSVAGQGQTWQDFINHCLPASDVEAESHKTDAFLNGMLDTVQDAVDKFFDWGDINWIANQERNIWDTDTNPGMIMISDGKGGQTGVFEQGDNGGFKWKKNHSLKALLTQMGQKIPDTPLTDEEKEAQNHKVVRAHKFNRWTKPRNMKDNNIVPDGPKPAAPNPG